MLLEVAAEGFALVSQVAGRLGEVHDASSRSRTRGRVIERAHQLERMQQAAHVVCEVVELEPEVTFGVGAEDFVKLANLAGRRIDLEELVAEHRPELGRLLPERHVRLEDLEDPCLVLHADAALLVGRATELVDFLQSPFGSNVAR